MNKYQKALDDLEDYSVKYVMNKDTRDDFREVMYRSIDRMKSTLQELVDKEVELQSRKDKLVVGSEWECVADCYSKHFIYDVGDVVKVLCVENGHILLKHYAIRDDVIKEQQFLLCFKPKEVTHE